MCCVSALKICGHCAGRVRRCRRQKKNVPINSVSVVLQVHRKALGHLKRNTSAQLLSVFTFVYDISS